MPAHSPDEVNPQLIDAINRGDLETALSLYEADAAFITEDGTAIGHEAIRPALEAFIGPRDDSN